MDQSYFRFFFQLAGKSKQSGLSKSEKSLAKRNATLSRAARQPEVFFFCTLQSLQSLRDFEQIFGQNASLRVKTLSNINLVA